MNPRMLACATTVRLIALLHDQQFCQLLEFIIISAEGGDIEVLRVEPQSKKVFGANMVKSAGRRRSSHVIFFLISEKIGGVTWVEAQFSYGL